MKKTIEAYFFGNSFIVAGVPEKRNNITTVSLNDYVIAKLDNFQSNKEKNSKNLLVSFYKYNKKVFEKLPLNDKMNYWTSFEYWPFD
jgi:hypothetical protein